MHACRYHQNHCQQTVTLPAPTPLKDDNRRDMHCLRHWFFHRCTCDPSRPVQIPLPKASIYRAVPVLPIIRDRDLGVGLINLPYMCYTIVIALHAQKAAAQDVEDMAEAGRVSDTAFDIAGLHVGNEAYQRVLACLVVTIEALEALDALVIGADVHARGDVEFQRVEV